MTGPLIKNIEHQLLKERSRKRRPGDVPYPVHFQPDLTNFANWDHMWLFPTTLTAHRMDRPPAVILDLGCGGGFWAIEVARKWQHSTVIGFDFIKIQPDLSKIKEYNELGRRVKWVHGNLLEKLPFPTHYFDYVHIVDIGLGVPEDEWQYVLEEIARVLKPGGLIEIIEEDLIFPCGPVPKARHPQLSLDIGKAIPSSRNSSATASAVTPSSISTNPWTVSSGSSARSMVKHYSITGLPSLPSISSGPSFPTLFDETTTTSSTLSFSSDEEPPSIPEPERIRGRDHSRLKYAWDAMLASRFLAPDLVSVLPLYLSSTFKDIRTHPAICIPLPLNSPARNSRSSQDSFESTESQNPFTLFDMRTPLAQGTGDILSDCESLCSGTASYRTVRTSASRHLAKSMRTVVACKEAIWVEYEKMHENEPTVPPVTTTNKEHLIAKKPMKAGLREEFESLWSDWENDMLDRIGTREYVCNKFSCDEPPGNPPDWTKWRDSVVGAGSLLADEITGEQEICRCIRGFVGWTPLAAAKPVR